MAHISLTELILYRNCVLLVDLKDFLKHEVERIPNILKDKFNNIPGDLWNYMSKKMKKDLTKKLK